MQAAVTQSKEFVAESQKLLAQQKKLFGKTGVISEFDNTIGTAETSYNYSMQAFGTISHSVVQDALSNVVDADVFDNSVERLEEFSDSVLVPFARDYRNANATIAANFKTAFFVLTLVMKLFLNDM